MKSNLEFKKVIIPRKWEVWELNWLMRAGLGVSEEELRSWGEMPVEYILGWAEFGDLKLVVNKNVLIPRLETEDLVNLIGQEMQLWISDDLTDKSRKIWEVGTGSGAIILSLKHNWGKMRVLDFDKVIENESKLAERNVGEVIAEKTLKRINFRQNKMSEIEWWASDVSEEALAVARENEKLVEKNADFVTLVKYTSLPEGGGGGGETGGDREMKENTKVEEKKEMGIETGLEIKEIDKINWFLSDLGEKLPQGLKFDLIVANLPYIPAKRSSELDKSVIDFEPKLALFGGEDGLEVIRRLLSQVGDFLSENGVIWLEVDESHVLEKYEIEFPEWKIQTFNDSFDRLRFWRLNL